MQIKWTRLAQQRHARFDWILISLAAIAGMAARH
jgi:hypothetical protein